MMERNVVRVITPKDLDHALDVAMGTTRVCTAAREQLVKALRGATRGGADPDAIDRAAVAVREAEQRDSAAWNNVERMLAAFVLASSLRP